MYLLFELTKVGIRYAAFTADADIVYDGFCFVERWDNKGVLTAFHQDLLTKVRGHGKVFTHIGIVVPYANRTHTKPTPARKDLLKKLTSSPLLSQANLGLESLLEACQKAWPHLTPWLLFDTFFSDNVERHTVVPPLPYDMIKMYDIHPVVRYSYGHASNLTQIKADSLTLSLYVDDQVSVATFKGTTLLDAAVAYSPFSSLMSIRGAGGIDAGLLFHLLEKRKQTDVLQLLNTKAGLLPMTETHFDLATVLQLSGLILRTDKELESVSIEVMEWIEIATRSFIRSLRQSIGGLVMDHGIKSLVINSSIIPETSGLWPIILKGALRDLKVTYSGTTLLQSACQDLIEHATK